MVPVVTAIVAAFIAGVIALYRERRLELADLLVAARVVARVSWSTSLLFEGLSERDHGYPRDQQDADVDAFTVAWTEHRKILARYLSAEQWSFVSDAAVFVPLAFNGQRAPRATEQAKLDVCWDASEKLRCAAIVLDNYGVRPGFIRNPGRIQETPPWPTLRSTREAD